MRKISLPTLSLGLLPTLLGTVVLIGWYTHNTTLIQVSPTFVPMQYNTALGFLMSGIGILFAVFYRLQLAQVCGLIVFLTGGLTLIEYGFVVDLGIDQLFMEHYVTTATSNPGRMAPNTALSFAVTGIALLFITGSNSSKTKLALIGIMGALAFGLGTIAAAGYATNLETAYGWGNLTRMAIHTAVGFLFIGLGLISYAWSKDRHQRTTLPSWLSYVVSIVFLTITVSLWQALNAIQAVGIAQYFVLVFGAVTAAALGGLVHNVGRLKNIADQRTQHLEAEITERSRAEEEAETAAALLREAIEAIPEGFVVYDSSDQLMLINQKMKEFYSRVAHLLEPGVTLAELLEEDFEQSENERDQSNSQKDAILEQYNSADGEPILRQGVDGRWIESRDHRISTGGVVGIRTDVTRYIEAEKELREQMDEIETFNNIAVGRELRMIELKSEINNLLGKLGQDTKYEIVE